MSDKLLQTIKNCALNALNSHISVLALAEMQRENRTSCLSTAADVISSKMHFANIL